MSETGIPDRGGYWTMDGKREKTRAYSRRESDEKTMPEIDKFLSKGSSEALKYFTGKCPMTQEGFEICIREMIQLGCDELYSEFTEKHRRFLGEFNQKIEILEEESRKDGLSDQEKEKMWTEIMKKIKDIKADQEE